MAAHSYRAWLFQHEGLTLWNAQWYGGHHVLGYSLLFAPLAAAIGPAYVGVLSAVAAVALFVPSRARRRLRPPRRAAAAWLLTAGVLSNVLIGRMPFLLGIALTVGAWSAGRSERRVLSGVLALCAMLASPVAGVFLMLGAAAKLIADGRPGCDRAVARAARPWRAGSGSTCSSPRAGRTGSPRPRSGRCS